MHNMKAKSSNVEPVKKPRLSGEKEMTSVPSPKEESNQDHDSDWDAGLEDQPTLMQDTGAQSEWEDVNADSLRAEPKPPTEVEMAMDVLLQAQDAACISSQLLLKDFSDDEDYTSAEDDEGDDIEDAVGSPISGDDGLGLEVHAKEEVLNSKEEKAYECFVKLFQENHQLRKLYEEKQNCGHFECLVCNAEGKR